MIQLAPVTVVRPLVVFAAALLRSIGVPALSQPAPPAPAARDVVAAVRASIDGVRARQAALPPPKDDAERLTRLGELDWAPRDVIMGFDFSLISPAERQAEVDAASALIDAVDRQDQAALLKLVPPDGWFLRSKYGEKAATSAFQIVQHADLALQLHFLPILAR